jgi:hypothetical protein
VIVARSLPVVRWLAAPLLVALGLGLLALKAWLSLTGPYLEALPRVAFCSEAAAALDEGRLAEALELAEAGGCQAEASVARARWDAAGAVAARCWEGVWTGVGGDDAAAVCAIASDLLVVGDLRDLTRQGIGWSRGEETDSVLVALSAAGVAFTFAPALSAGSATVKVARRSGTLTRGLGDSVTTLARQREWRALGGALGDAGRLRARLGPAGSARALAYADSPADLARLASFVERVPHPLLALRWGGKGVLRIDDDVVYAAALSRGPRGLALASERGAAALLTGKPLVLGLVKVAYARSDALGRWALRVVTYLVSSLSWGVALVAAALLVAVGLLLMPRRRRLRQTRVLQREWR